MTSQTTKTASNNRRTLGAALCLATMLGGAAVAGAQTPYSLQIPYASTAVGLPAATPALTVCGSSTTDSVGSIGNLCPPTQAKLSSPRAVYIDPNTGNIFISDYTDDQIREIYMSGANELQRLVNGYNNLKVVSTTSVVPGYIYNACGAYSGVFTSISTSGGSCGNTKLTPVGLGMDPAGNLIEDEGGARMRVVYSTGTALANLINNTLGQAGGVTPKSGYQYVLMYGESNAYYGDGGNALAALVSSAKGLWVDANENIYIADYGNNAIREINGTTGIITTIAGAGSCSNNVCTCTAGTTCAPNTTCSLGTVGTYVTVGTLTNIVPNAMATTGGCAKGAPSGTPGPALSSNLSNPYDVMMDANGNIYIADYGNAQVRAIYEGKGSIPGVTTPQLGYIYTVAGGGTLTTGGPALQVKFSSVSGIGFDAAGNLYIGDYLGGKIWEVDAKTQIAVIVAGGGTGVQGAACSTTFAGGPTRTYANGDGCLGTLATLGTPYGRISFDASGNMYVADYTANVVREFSHTVLPAATTAVGSSSPAALAFASLNSATVTLQGATFGVQGVSSSDFSDAGGSTCNTLNQTLASGATCYLNVLFKPTVPGLREGEATVKTTTSSFVGSNFLDGTGTGAEIAMDSATPVTVGSGTVPLGIASDPSGAIYVADKTSNSVLRYASSTATTPTTLISGLSSPGQVAVDGEGNVYVADTGNNRVAVYSAATATVSYVTGGYSSPQGVIVDGYGNLYVADTGNNRVVRITPYQAVTVVANTSSTPVAIATPTQLSLDANGNLYVVNSGTSQVLQITGTLNNTTVAVALGQFNPVSFAVDAANDYYVLDKSTLQVGFISAQGATTTTLLSGLTTPTALSVDAYGNLYIADSAAGVTYMNRQQITSSFYPLDAGAKSTFSSFLVTNIGSSTLNYTGSAPFSGSGSTADFTVYSSANNGCSVSTPLTSGAWCSISAYFSPVAVGNFSDALTIPSNAANAATATSTLLGSGVNLPNSNMAISSNPSSSTNINYGTPVILTFQLTLSGSTAATGKIIVSVDGIKLATLTPAANGSATFTFSPANNNTLNAGTHTVAAQYTGDANYTSSYATLTPSLTIVPAPTTTSITYSGALLSVQGSNLPAYTLTAPVTSTVTPTGVVYFYAGSLYLGFGALNKAGVASLTVACGAQPTFTASTTTALATAMQTFCPSVNGTTSTPIVNPSFKAVYQTSANYTTSTSSGLTVNGDFGMTTQAFTLAEPQGEVASTTISVVPYMGLNGTVTFSCSNLPTNAVCRFLTCPSVPTAGNACPVQSNTNLTFTGNTVTFIAGTNPSTTDIPGQLTLELFTDVVPTLSERRAPDVGHGHRGLAECGLTLLGGLLLLGLRRRTSPALRRLMLVALLVILPLLAGVGLTACGSGTNYYDLPSVTTPVGTTNFTLTATSSNGTVESMPITMVVGAGN